MDKHLHIVCFDVPYPPDYGGVTDVFYRIKALHELGVKIHLHCFEYGRNRHSELNKYCTEVNYYKRNTGLSGISFRLPYIVMSRANKELQEKLLKDEHPVLLEGIHCTYFLFTGQLKNKKVFVRLHNVEYEYYQQLGNKETSFFKRFYYIFESKFLRSYEKKIANKAVHLPITHKDADKYQSLTGNNNIKYLPAFLPYNSVSSKTGTGDFCLYHGNLSVSENERAAIWLCENVFNQLNTPLSIAGKNPSKKLADIIEQNKNITLISNPSGEKMNEVISNAQINILPTFNSTGIKIKFLNALFTGRHCLVNKATAQATGLESLCHIAETEEEFRTAVKELFDKPFTMQEIEKRNELIKEFDNKVNAELLMQWIY